MDLFHYDCTSYSESCSGSTSHARDRTPATNFLSIVFIDLYSNKQPQLPHSLTIIDLSYVLSTACESYHRPSESEDTAGRLLHFQLISFRSRENTAASPARPLFALLSGLIWVAINKISLLTHSLTERHIRYHLLVIAHVPRVQ